MWHKLNNKREEAIAITDLSLFYYGFGDDNRGISAAKKAYDLASKENEPGSLIFAMMAVSQGFVNTRKFDEARAMAKRVLEAGIEHNNLIAQFVGHHNWADCAMMEGKFREAETQYGKGIGITLQSGEMNYTYTDLVGVAMAVAGQGRYEKALRIMGAVNVAVKKAGLSSPEESGMIFWQEMIQKHIVGTRSKLGEELTEAYESNGRKMNLDELIAYALDTEKD